MGRPDTVALTREEGEVVVVLVVVVVEEERGGDDDEYVNISPRIPAKRELLPTPTGPI